MSSLTSDLINLPFYDKGGHVLDEDAAKLLAYQEVLMCFREEGHLDYICQTFLDFGLIDQAIDLVKQNCKNEDGQLEDLFFRILKYLINKKMLPRYVDEIKDLMPPEFDAFQFYNLLSESMIEVGGSKVFVSSEKDLNFGAIEPVLSKIFAKTDRKHTIIQYEATS